MILCYLLKLSTVKVIKPAVANVYGYEPVFIKHGGNKRSSHAHICIIGERHGING